MVRVLLRYERHRQANACVRASRCARVTGSLRRCAIHIHLLLDSMLLRAMPGLQPHCRGHGFMCQFHRTPSSESLCACNALHFCVSAAPVPPLKYRGSRIIPPRANARLRHRACAGLQAPRSLRFVPTVCGYLRRYICRYNAVVEFIGGSRHIGRVGGLRVTPLRTKATPTSGYGCAVPRVRGLSTRRRY